MSNQSQHLAFIAAVLAQVKAQGLPSPTLDPSTESGLPENKGYVFIEWGAHGAAPALIVPKAANGVRQVDSHIDLSDMDGHIPLSKPNGRVVCRMEGDVAKVSRALARFVGASKRPVAAPVRQPVASPVKAPPGKPTDVLSAPVVALTDMFPGLAAQADVPATDEQVDEALAALNA
jgi:hypothetical protein